MKSLKFTEPSEARMVEVFVYTFDRFGYDQAVRYRTMLLAAATYRQSLRR